MCAAGKNENAENLCRDFKKHLTEKMKLGNK